MRRWTAEIIAKFGICCALVAGGGIADLSGQTGPDPAWSFTPTPASGLVLGQAEWDGVPASAEDFVGAFLPDGGCAGWTQPVISDGTAYFSLAVYGDDAITPDVVEGPAQGESFELHFYHTATSSWEPLTDASGNPQLFVWSNTFGVPISGLDDPMVAYDWTPGATDTTDCNDAEACNYVPTSTSNADCTYPEPFEDCQGNCLADADGDGICDHEEQEGCTYEVACNYDPTALHDDGSCAFPTPGFDCSGNCTDDADGDGVCDFEEIPGCTDVFALNYNPAATDGDEVFCVYTDCYGDINGDGVIGTGDLLGLLSVYGENCE